MLIRRYTEKAETFLRDLTEAQEDTLPWHRRGGYRWFKSPNVTPIEYYKRVYPNPRSSHPVKPPDDTKAA